MANIAASIRVQPLRDEDRTILRLYGVNFDIDDEVRAQESLRLGDERLARALRAASGDHLPDRTTRLGWSLGRMLGMPAISGW
ncbi:hypothetical protein [Mesorhizobium sp. M0276]|uniref:hypothetical protein n=1 Tax=Mesorhizobium sp. M0276 TaxID=2956928 RepID=UPI00333B6974